MKLKRVKYNDTDRTDVLVEVKGGWFPVSHIYEVADLFNYSEEKGFSDDIILRILQRDEHFQKRLIDLLEALDTGEAVSSDEVTTLIPIMPGAYRDFMLSEEHVINASRGFVKKFMPFVYRVTSAYEKIFGKPFPAFKPNKYWYQAPIYYFGNHLNFTCDDRIVKFPDYCDGADYELELGAFLKKGIKNASIEEARDAIGGFVILNDLSMRGLQVKEMKSGFGPQKAKSFENMISGMVVTPESAGDYNNLKATVSINGSEVVSTSTSGMYYDLAEAIAYASKGEQLHPGEFFGSGTLPGGSGMENGYWLKAGDEIEFTIENLGSLVFKT